MAAVTRFIFTCSAMKAMRMAAIVLVAFQGNVASASSEVTMSPYTNSSEAVGRNTATPSGIIDSRPPSALGNGSDFLSTDLTNGSVTGMQKQLWNNVTVNSTSVSNTTQAPLLATGNTTVSYYGGMGGDARLSQYVNSSQAGTPTNGILTRQVSTGSALLQPNASTTPSYLRTTSSPAIFSIFPIEVSKHFNSTPPTLHQNASSATKPTSSVSNISFITVKTKNFTIGEISNVTTKMATEKPTANSTPKASTMIHLNVTVYPLASHVTNIKPQVEAATVNQTNNGTLGRLIANSGPTASAGHATVTNEATARAPSPVSSMRPLPVTSKGPIVSESWQTTGPRANSSLLIPSLSSIASRTTASQRSQSTVPSTPRNISAALTSTVTHAVTAVGGPVGGSASTLSINIVSRAETSAKRDEAITNKATVIASTLHSETQRFSVNGSRTLLPVATITSAIHHISTTTTSSHVENRTNSSPPLTSARALGSATTAQPRLNHNNATAAERSGAVATSTSKMVSRAAETPKAADIAITQKINVTHASSGAVSYLTLTPRWGGNASGTAPSVTRAPGVSLLTTIIAGRFSNARNVTIEKTSAGGMTSRPVNLIASLTNPANKSDTPVRLTTGVLHLIAATATNATAEHVTAASLQTLKRRSNVTGAAQMDLRISSTTPKLEIPLSVSSSSASATLRPVDRMTTNSGQAATYIGIKTSNSSQVGKTASTTMQTVTNVSERSSHKSDIVATLPLRVLNSSTTWFYKVTGIPLSTAKPVPVNDVSKSAASRPSGSASTLRADDGSAQLSSSAKTSTAAPPLKTSLASIKPTIGTETRSVISTYNASSLASRTTSHWMTPAVSTSAGFPRIFTTDYSNRSRNISEVPASTSVSNTTTQLAATSAAAKSVSAVATGGTPPSRTLGATTSRYGIIGTSNTATTTSNSSRAVDPAGNNVTRQPVIAESLGSSHPGASVPTTLARLVTFQPTNATSRPMTVVPSIATAYLRNATIANYFSSLSSFSHQYATDVVSTTSGAAISAISVSDQTNSSAIGQPASPSPYSTLISASAATLNAVMRSTLNNTGTATLSTNVSLTTAWSRSGRNATVSN